MRGSTGLLLLALVALCSAVFPHGKSKWQKLSADVDRLPNYTPLDYSNGTFTQPIDHANPKLGTWQQHYQVMNQYQNTSAESSLVFLMIGGEGPAGPSWINNPNLQYIQWAKEFGALCFQVEHRFFGKSRPYPDMTAEHLKYLTTEQALADLASFIDGVNHTQYNLTNPRWITFGGSYPGSMAAWFRSKYPNHTIGSVASSAPLNLKLDFYEYTMVMQDTIQGVSKKCYDAVNQTFTVLQQKTLTTEGRNELNDAFTLTPNFDDSNVTALQLTNFLAGVYGTFQGVIQYTYDGRNNETVGGLNVKNMCDVLTNGTLQTDSDYVAAAVRVLQWNSQMDLTFTGYGDGAFINDYKEGLKYIENVNYDYDNGDPDGRGWYWLCCNEIGFMQTTSQGYNIFQDIVPLGFYFQQCVDIFGPSINATYVRDNNHKAQNYYGGVDYFNATNLVLPNGSLDPWHALGYYKADNASNVYPKLIEGTAHCSDMYASYEGEPAALKDARAFIHEQVQFYIDSSVPVGPTTATKPKGASTVAFSALVVLIAAIVNQF